MQKHTCPGCGKTWYSAAAEQPWQCEVCGAIIPVPGEENDVTREAKSGD